MIAILLMQLPDINCLFDFSFDCVLLTDLAAVAINIAWLHGNMTRAEDFLTIPLSLNFTGDSCFAEPGLNAIKIKYTSAIFF
jgi:hypothetical protein